MKIKAIMMTTLISLFVSNCFALSTSKLEHYIFQYETQNTYDIQLTESTITWTGVQGSDQGRTETDAVQRKKLNDDVEVLQWQEHSGDFVTVVLDRKQHKVISSIKSGDNKWLNQGVVA